MIRLGYAWAKPGYQGNALSPPTQDETGILVADKTLAERQLADIKAYLSAASWALGWMNGSHFTDGGKRLKTLEAYSVSESSALSLDEIAPSSSSPTPEFHLNVNLVTAVKNRKALPWRSKARRKGKYKPSWILERLNALANPKITPIHIDVWKAQLERIYGQTGGKYQGFNWMGGNKLSAPKDGAKNTESWVRLTDYFTRFEYYDSELRGGVYVHELIVHAWRNVKFGYVPLTKPPTWSPLIWAMRQPHLGKYHVEGASTTQHTVADAESDFLDWYLYFDRKWVYEPKSKLKVGARHAVDTVGVFARNVKPPLDAFGDNWFTDEGREARIKEKNRWVTE